MAKYMMIVFSNPVEGKEDEYEDWYSNVHVSEIVEKVPGFVSAQRFAMVPEHSNGGRPDHRYLAVYDVETDDPEKTFAKLSEMVTAGALVNSDALCRETLGRGFYVPVTDRLEA